MSLHGLLTETVKTNIWTSAAVVSAIGVIALTAFVTLRYRNNQHTTINHDHPDDANELQGNIVGNILQTNYEIIESLPNSGDLNQTLGIYEDLRCSGDYEDVSNYDILERGKTCSESNDCQMHQYESLQRVEMENSNTYL